MQFGGHEWHLQGRPAVWRSREELNSQLKNEDSLEAGFFYLEDTQSLLLMPSDDWMRYTHVMEGNVFTQSSWI